MVKAAEEVTSLARRAFSIMAPIGVLALWAGLAMAARRYPTEFDWRYMTMSTLFSPRDNPAGRQWATAGIGLCGLALLFWTGTWHGASPPSTSNAGHPSAIWSLRFGSAFMLGSGLLPLRLPGLPKGHELLTLLAFAGLSVGTVQMTFATVERFVEPPSGGGSSRSKFYAVVIAGLVVVPIVLAGLAQLYVFYARPDLHWVGLSWRARGVPLYLSFAFWEWLTVAILSVYLCVVPLAIASMRSK
jgi:hypothetical protein